MPNDYLVAVLSLPSLVSNGLEVSEVIISRSPDLSGEGKHYFEAQIRKAASVVDARIRFPSLASDQLLEPIYGHLLGKMSVDSHTLSHILKDNSHSVRNWSFYQREIRPFW